MFKKQFHEIENLKNQVQIDWLVLKAEQLQNWPKHQFYQIAIFLLVYKLFYNCSAFGAHYFFVNFSYERQSERIERQLKTQNSTPPSYHHHDPFPSIPNQHYINNSNDVQSQPTVFEFSIDNLVQKNLNKKNNNYKVLLSRHKSLNSKQLESICQIKGKFCKAKVSIISKNDKRCYYYLSIFCNKLLQISSDFRI